MVPVTVRRSALGFTEWVVLDQYVRGFVVGLGAKMSSNGNLTYSVEHTFDPVMTPYSPLTITRTTTVATITFTTNHGLSVADFVRIIGAGAPFEGSYAVATVPDQTSVTVTVADAGPTSVPSSTKIVTARIFPHTTLVAKTASADGNYVAPPIACRLNVTAYTGGYVDLTVVQAGK